MDEITHFLDDDSLLGKSFTDSTEIWPQVGCFINPFFTYRMKRMIADMMVLIHFTQWLVDILFSGTICSHYKCLSCHLSQIFSSPFKLNEKGYQTKLFLITQLGYQYQTMYKASLNLPVTFLVMIGSSFAWHFDFVQHILEAKVWFSKFVIINDIHTLWFHKYLYKLKCISFSELTLYIVLEPA